jgi:hypothetical protein
VEVFLFNYPKWMSYEYPSDLKISSQKKANIFGNKYTFQETLTAFFVEDSDEARSSILGKNISWLDSNQRLYCKNIYTLFKNLLNQLSNSYKSQNDASWKISISQILLMNFLLQAKQRTVNFRLSFTL